MQTVTMDKNVFKKIVISNFLKTFRFLWFFLYDRENNVGIGCKILNFKIIKFVPANDVDLINFNKIFRCKRNYYVFMQLFTDNCMNTYNFLFIIIIYLKSLHLFRYFICKYISGGSNTSINFAGRPVLDLRKCIKQYKCEKYRLVF